MARYQIVKERTEKATGRIVGRETWPADEMPDMPAVLPEGGKRAADLADLKAGLRRTTYLNGETATVFTVLKIFP